MSVGECRVCGVRAHGIHFGVLSCRACAAFFRRTVALRLNYACRDRSNNCNISKAAGIMCRQCRHQKCVKLGMNETGVQLNRDFIKPTKAKEKNDLKEKDEEMVQLPEPQPSSNFSAAAALGLNRIDDFFSNDFLNTSSEPNFLTLKLKSIMDTPPNDEICNIPNLCQLYRLLFGYKRLQERRELFMKEKVLVAMETTRLSQGLTERPKPKGRTLTAAAEMFHNSETFEYLKMELPLIAELLMYLDGFQILPPDQKWLVFKGFWMRFFFLDGLYRRYENDYGEYLRRKAEQGDILANMNIDEARFLQHRLNSLIIPMGLLKPNDIEFCAMVVSVLWNLDGRDDISLETLEAAREQKAQLYDELHAYYSKEKTSALEVYGVTSATPPNYAHRIATICAIVHTIDMVIQQKTEDFGVLRIFGLIDFTSSSFEVLQALHA